MTSLDPKIIVVIFIKNLFGTVYIIPLWFIIVYVFEHVWVGELGIISEELVILLLEGSGVIFFVLLVLGCYYWAWLTFSNFTYELQSDGFHIRKGIIIKRHTIIPYSDIESVDLLVNPFVVRFLDLYALQIKTRELLNTEGIFRKKLMQHIPGLTSETARSLRIELLKDSHIQVVKKTFFDPTTGRYR